MLLHRGGERQLVTHLFLIDDALEQVGIFDHQRHLLGDRHQHPEIVIREVNSGVPRAD